MNKADYEKDPMGYAMVKFLKEPSEDHILVRSELCEDDEMLVPYLFRDFAGMPEVERKALMLAKGRVLDVGAGAGSHALYLQKQGLDVTALDISPGCIEACEMRGVEQAVLGDFYKVTEKYDTLLFCMNGIGIGGRLADLSKTFEKIKELLAPNGVAYFDSSDIIYMYPDDQILEEDGPAYYGHWDYQMEIDGVVGDWFKWLYVDFELAAKYASENGLTCELLHEGAHHDYLAALRFAK